MKKIINKISPLSLIILSQGVACGPTFENTKVIPAEAYSRAAKSNSLNSYSFKRASQEQKEANERDAGFDSFKTSPTYQGDPKMLAKGLSLKRSFSASPTLASNTDSEKMFAMGGGEGAKRGQLNSNLPTPSPLSNNGVDAHSASDVTMDGPPPGSSAPYLNGQMKANPSLWPDQVQGQFIFTDHRAYNPMDIVTVVINDNTIGQKRGDTQTKSQFDLLAGITNFLGIESRWESNNEGLDSTALIQANTKNEYKGTANIQRQGLLQAQLSAVILELLPNGVLRLEGSKIVSINSEEEIMVISGLVRQRDISSDNKVDSNRIANMRIDFYGHGNLSEAQNPGWGARLFSIEFG
jgi:flagellar L-ring protein precursor FlgH